MFKNRILSHGTDLANAKDRGGIHLVIKCCGINLKTADQASKMTCQAVKTDDVLQGLKTFMDDKDRQIAQLKAEKAELVAGCQARDARIAQLEKKLMEVAPRPMDPVVRGCKAQAEFVAVKNPHGSAPIRPSAPMASPSTIVEMGDDDDIIPPADLDRVEGRWNNRTTLVAVQHPPSSVGPSKGIQTPPVRNPVTSNPPTHHHVVNVAKNETLTRERLQMNEDARKGQSVKHPTPNPVPHSVRSVAKKEEPIRGGPPMKQDAWKDHSVKHPLAQQPSHDVEAPARGGQQVWKGRSPPGGPSQCVLFFENEV